MTNPFLLQRVKRGILITSDQLTKRGHKVGKSTKRFEQHANLPYTSQQIDGRMMMIKKKNKMKITTTDCEHSLHCSVKLREKREFQQETCSKV